MRTSRPDPGSRIALALVFTTVVIDLVGFGIVLPLLPFYATELGASAVDVGLIIASFSAMQFLLAPVWGRLSDRLGRRPVLIVGLFGSAASYVIFGLAGSVAVLLLSRVIAGIMGANVAVAQAYIADRTSDEDRARGMGLIGAAFGLGFVLGPAIGGVLSRWGYGVPGFFAAGLSLASAGLAVLYLPESLPEEVVDEAEVGAPAAGDTAVAALRGRLAGLTGALRVPGLRDPIGAIFLATLGFAAFTTTFPLLLGDPLGMTSEDAGWYFAFVGFVSMTVQGVLVGPTVRRFGEQRVAVVGALALGSGLCILSWLNGPYELLMSLAVVGVGWGYTIPSLQSLVSRRAGREAQGGALGVNQSASSLARVLGPLAGGWAFGALGFRVEFLATAAAVLAAALWTWRMAPPPEADESRLAA